MAIPNLDELIATTTLEPRPYQNRIVTKATTCFTQVGMRSVMIEAPTGSGKTAMAQLTVKSLQLHEPDLQVCWVAARRNLLAQAMRANLDTKINASIHFASMFAKGLPAEFLAAPRRMIVLDEGHHDACESMASLHSQARADYILGLSGTPYRLDRVKLCFDTIVKDAGIGALIRDGYLSQYDHYTIPKWGPAEVAQLYLREPERWGKSIAYFHTLEQAGQAYTILRDAGVRVEFVTGDSDREAQLDAFDNDKVDIIVNCLVLTEGMDCPSLKTAFVRPSCKGITVQMAGRVFRPHQATPVKQVVQCGRTKWPMIKTAMPKTQYVMDDDGYWRSLTINPNINRISCNTLMALAHVRTEMHSYFKGKQPLRRRRHGGDQ